MLRTLRLALAVALVVASACGSSSTAGGRLGEIQSRGLRVAGAIAPPSVIQSPDGSFSGLEIDLTRAYAQQLGVKFTVVPAGWDAVVAGVQTDKWDLITSICITPARQKVVDFTNPLVEYKWQFVMLSNNPKGQPTTIAEVNDPKWVVVVTTGSAQEEYIKQVAPKATLKEIPGTSDADNVQQVLAGHADILITDYPVTVTIIKNSYAGRFNFFPADVSSLPVTCPGAWALPKGDGAFQSSLNAFLAASLKNGLYDSLKAKYFSPQYLHF